ncbi:pilus assembly protein TadB [Paraburkholderia madseniana]|uniref:Pilus assembly protein TadB n=1 Tax=Paraburkholderia madseniana TaxID=2599607 RepID=A0A6N6WEZ1_9BURK|nr:type II secretion system F family protein [Paraburkholderia madseniana]KAE8758671.1 pilus assembly protein TadB [Paraburkholderia madseniana]
MNRLFLGFAVLLFFAVVLVIEAGYLWWNSHHGPVVKRLDQRIRAMSVGGEIGTAQLSILKARLLSDSPSLTKLLLAIPRIHMLDRLLLQSGRDWSVGRFLTYTLVLPCVAAAVALCLGVPLLPSLALAAVFALLPLGHVHRSRSKRIAVLERQLPEAADLISRALRAGHSFPSSLGMVGEELANPLGGEFQTTFDEISYGVSMNDALKNMVARVPVMDLRYFVIAVLIQREAGGNLSEILDSISQIIRERLKLLSKVKVLSAEGRLSAWILGALPFALAGVIMLINPDFFMGLINDPAGLKMIGVSLVSMLLGIVWMRKVIRIHV